MQLYTLIPTLLILAFDPEGEQKTDAAPISFTQDQLNKALAEDRRKHDDTRKKLTDEINTLKSRSNLTADEASELSKRLEETNSKYMTETELKNSELKKLKTSYDTDTKKLSDERDGFKSRFERSTIHRAITDASATEGAFSAGQIIPLLERDARVVDIIDEDGKPTGDVEVKIKFKTFDDKKKAITLDLPAAQAVKRMKEDESYGNLFKGVGKGGLGDTNRGGSGNGTLDLAELAKDPEKYRAAKAKGLI